MVFRRDFFHEVFTHACVFFTAFFTGRIAVFHGARARENPVFHGADASVKNGIREKRPREKRETKPSKPLPKKQFLHAASVLSTARFFTGSAED